MHTPVSFRNCVRTNVYVLGLSEDMCCEVPRILRSHATFPATLCLAAYVSSSVGDYFLKVARCTTEPVNILHAMCPTRNPTLSEVAPVTHRPLNPTVSFPEAAL